MGETIENFIRPIFEATIKLKSQSLLRNFSRFYTEMSLQYDVEEFIRPLINAIYESSEEDMEVDSASVTAIEQDQDSDSDIEVIVCYRETPVYPPQLAGGEQ